MAVWWVFQNKSYERSRAGGYLWAPLVDKEGHKKSHWEAVDQVQPGDLILSSKDRQIVATSVALSAAYKAPQPDPLDAENWTGEGRRVDVAYADLPEPIAVDDLEPLFPLLQADSGPIAASGRGKQGYLFPVHPVAAKQILERVDRVASVQEIVGAASDLDKPEPITVGIRTQKIRVGQQVFRDKVLTLWSGRCAVTGVDDPRLLIASHIKPWGLANNRERLDPLNGLLLEAGIDQLFDQGLITFETDGRLLISDSLSEQNRDALGLGISQMRLSVKTGSEDYLAFHRSNIFQA
jgi:putative restriction endonuclease